MLHNKIYLFLGCLFSISLVFSDGDGFTLQNICSEKNLEKLQSLG